MSLQRKNYDPATMYGGVDSDQPGGISLADAHILVGNSSGVAADVAMSGDITIGDTGVTAIGAAKVTGAMRKEGVAYNCVSVVTNGTTPVNVFGAGGAPCALTITEVLTNSQDTTAGNITVKQAANTVCTIAKSATAGVMVGAGALSNATYAASDVCTVVSSSAGNARVTIVFTVA